jgi:hypothetical protein
MKTKTCTYCGEEKPVTEFGRIRKYVHHWCKPCRAIQSREAKYGLDAEDFKSWCEAQDNKCRICKEPLAFDAPPRKRLIAVDHCHTTGKVCGILCKRCNVTIGSFKENPQLLRAAADYCERTKKSAQ